VRLVPARGAGGGGVAEEDADLLHVPGQARPPRHCRRLLASLRRLLPLACVSTGTGTRAARMNGHLPFGADAHHPCLEGGWGSPFGCVCFSG
jgi:hypothetical protein